MMLNSQYFSKSNELNRKKREQKFQILVKQITDLLTNNQQNLTYLANGSEYKLKFSIKCDDSEFSNTDYSFITKIQCWNTKNEMETNDAEDILPQLRKSKNLDIMKNEGLQVSTAAIKNITDQLNSIYKQCQKNIVFLDEQIQTTKMLTYSQSIAKTLMLDLLDLAQVENKTFNINKTNFSLMNVIDGAFGVVSHLAELKQVTLVHPKLTYEQKSYFRSISGDQSRIMQVLINFLSNSLKFSEKGSQINVNLKVLESQFVNVIQEPSRSVQLEVNPSLGFLSQNQESQLLTESQQQEISLPQHQNQTNNSSCSFTCFIKFQIDIQDFGCGIPEDKLHSLFINFGNLEEHRKQNPTGRGLGLSICKSIVEQMGGSVEVFSQVGQGTTFSIILKCKCNVDTDSLKIPSIKYSNNQSFDYLRSMFSQPGLLLESNERRQQIEEIKVNVVKKNKNLHNILIANDEQFLLVGYQLQLESHYKVFLAENGLQAVQIVSGKPKDFFSAIILDINMPIMDGYEACKHIYAYLNDSNQIIGNQQYAKDGLLRQSKTMIYSLTSDYSEFTRNRLSEFPFDHFLSNLDPTEIQKIKQDVDKIKVFPSIELHADYSDRGSSQHVFSCKSFEPAEVVYPSGGL